MATRPSASPQALKSDPALGAGNRRPRRAPCSPMASSRARARRWRCSPIRPPPTRRVAAVRAQLDLAGQTAKLGDAAALEARLAANPADYQARFDLALLLNAKGDRAGAVDRPP